MYAVLKRSFDIVAAFLGLLVLAPIGLLIALAVKLSDGGTVFFRQTRVGRGGRPFQIWKFRSMVPNAHLLGAQVTKDEDPRITRMGRLLRKTKLDELPQLWNVLVGEMSFVGPRPEVPRYVELYTPEQRKVLDLKPGITDLATLLFRGEEDLLRGTGDLEKFYVTHCMPKKVELNIEYSRRATFFSDIGIILRTVFPYWVGVLAWYAIALSASLWLSLQLHSDFQTPAPLDWRFLQSLGLMLLPQLVALSYFGQARGLISYFSIPELRRTALAIGAALVAQFALFQLFRSVALPPSVLVINGILSFSILCGLRVGLRLRREHRTSARPSAPARRVAIIGTGDLATDVALDLMRGRHAQNQVVAFFDDDPHTWHTRRHDIPVIGMPECLLNPEWQNKVDEVIVALGRQNPQRERELSGMLQSVPFKTTVATTWPANKALTL